MSLLPLPWLYAFTSGLGWLLFRVLRYRRKVIAQNLKIVFPDATDEYRTDLESQFIDHFTEFIAEFIKVRAISREELRRRFDIHISDELAEEFRQGKDVFLAGAHVNNWEWAVIAGGDQLAVRPACIYKPLASRAMDRIMIETREQFGTHMVPMAQVLRDILSKDRPPTAYLFLSDQSTPFTMTAHWPVFFGQKTPFVSGMSTIAVRQNIPIYYFYIEKIKRGFYEARFEPMVVDPQQHTPEEITELYSKKVMENILNQPACWLWTHKRWKRVLQY